MLARRPPAASRTAIDRRMDPESAILGADGTVTCVPVVFSGMCGIGFCEARCRFHAFGAIAPERIISDY